MEVKKTWMGGMWPTCAMGYADFGHVFLVKLMKHPPFFSPSFLYSLLQCLLYSLRPARATSIPFMEHCL